MYSGKVVFKAPEVARAVHNEYRGWCRSQGVPVKDHAKLNGKEIEISDVAQSCLDRIVYKLSNKMRNTNYHIEIYQG